MDRGAPPLAPDPPAVALEASIDLAEELDREERSLTRGRPAIRVAILKGRSVSFGIGVRPEAEYLRRARDEGIPTIPRRTGGTGLVHRDGDLVWSIVLPRADPRVGRDFVRAYDRLGRGAVGFLEAIGWRGQWIDAPGISSDYCTLSARGKVLSVGSRILGGAAQHVVGRGVLHQGTISVDLDRGEIDRLFGLPTPGPTSSLAGLRELGVEVETWDLARTLARSIESALLEG